jgi:hypothetical protein
LGTFVLKSRILFLVSHLQRNNVGTSRPLLLRLFFRSYDSTGPHYSGLNIAENYTDLGYGHLQYMVGHLKMEDEATHKFK